MTHGMGRWAAIVAAVALAVTAIALAFALAAGASAHADDQELAQRLVPAAGAAEAVLAGYTAESSALRDYVTTGRPAALASFRQAAGQLPGQQSRAAALAGGYPPMRGRLTAVRAALGAWQSRVAGPQLAAIARGDAARARTLQNDVPLIRPYSLAVRTRIAGLQAQITSEQARVVVRLADAQLRLLTALAAVCAVVAVVAVGVVAAVRRWLLRPFRILHQAAESVAAGHYDTPIPAVGPAELGELSQVGERVRTRLVAALAEAEGAQAGLRALNTTLEQQVQQRTAHLELANQNLAAFAYTAAHDLRTPLRAISGFAVLLTQEYGGRLDDTGRSYAGRIEAAGEHMGAVLDGLSDLSRVSQADIHLQDVDLSTVVTAICAQLRARDPGRRVRVTIEDGIRVTADPSLIRTALDSLLENAWKYTAGRDDAAIEFTTVPVTGACVCCSVRDNGTGFDPAYTGKLFQPFQQLHGADEYGGAGTGTGLATVRRIVERHGGQAWAEGAVGQGATFYLTLAAPGTPGSGGPDLLTRGTPDDQGHPRLAQPQPAEASTTPVPATVSKQVSGA